MKRNQGNMRKRKSSKKKKNFNIVHVAAFAFILYFLVTFSDQQIKINKYNSQIDMYEKEIEAKQDLVEYYQNKNENIKTDEYIESVAREKLELVKPFDIVYIDSNK